MRRAAAEVSFVFIREHEAVAETWERDGAAPYGDLVGCYWDEEYDPTREDDWHLFGERIAHGLELENDGPEYRRWERELYISDRYRRGILA